MCKKEGISIFKEFLFYENLLCYCIPEIFMFVIFFFRYALGMSLLETASLCEPMSAYDMDNFTVNR